MSEPIIQRVTREIHKRQRTGQPAPVAIYLGLAEVAQMRDEAGPLIYDPQIPQQRTLANIPWYRVSDPSHFAIR